MRYIEICRLYNKMVEKKEIGLGDLIELAVEKIRAEEVVIREVKSFGFGAAHITGINKDYIGRKVKIIIPKKEEEEPKKIQ